jgi:tetratricopeptide (TPR) repeat protein
MRQYKNLLPYLAVGAVMVSCSDLDEQFPEGGNLTQDQVTETNEAVPERTEASFNGMFSMMYEPGNTFASGRADDFGVIAMAISQDAEGSDFIMADNNYNWFSTACALSTRNASYANPYMRYVLPYRQIGAANEIINNIDEATENATSMAMLAQAHAVRAFDYLSLAPYFQFGYTTAKDQPCVPILTADVDYANNPRATVAEVYDNILADLDFAIEHLDGYDRGSDVSKINLNVAYGLRARAYLNMGEWAKAAADATKALEGYTPATVAEVSVPAFCNATEHNWIWGIAVNYDLVLKVDAAGTGTYYATSSSWISAFSGDGYAAATGCTPMINNLLYNLIPSTDVRKGWWLDENLHSPNWADLKWDDAQGDEIATLVKDDDSKVAFTPYTNIKFGQKSGVGSTVNNSDYPLMRAEEMILIQAEGYAKSGNEALARQILTDFVQTYRDPAYSIPASRSLADEIWFQRRVELWGEGFATNDLKRLNKPVVRFHSGATSNVPDAFQFNIESTDGWLNMRFPQDELDNNLAIEDNTGGAAPVAGQNPDLKDGVTD